MRGLIYSCAMRTVPTSAMCYCTCSDVMRASRGAHTQASRPPLRICGAPEITYGHAVCASQTKYKNCKPELAEKDSHCHAQ